MDHEDEGMTHSSTTNGRDYVRNGRHSKKKKEKEKPVKLPQRGKGVAALEKQMMLEEKNIKGVELEVSSSLVNKLSTPQHADVLYNMSGSAPNTRTLHQRDNCYSYAPGNPHLIVGHQSASASQLNNAGPGFGFPTLFFATQGNGNGNQMSSEIEYTWDMETSTRSVHNANISDGPKQLGNQQSYLCPPSKVNQITANSSSAVLNFQTEPPSNQSLCSIYRYVQSDEVEKSVATKRRHLFSPDDLPDPIDDCKYNPFKTTHALERSTSLRTSGQGSFVTNGNLSLRGGLPCSESMPNLQVRKDFITDGAISDDGFLELGPLATTPLVSGLKSKQALSNDVHQAQLPNLDSTIYTVHAQGSNLQGGSSISANHQQQGLNPTSPPALNNTQNGQLAVLSNHNDGNTEDNLDLSLRL